VQARKRERRKSKIRYLFMRIPKINYFSCFNKKDVAASFVTYIDLISVPGKAYFSGI